MANKSIYKYPLDVWKTTTINIPEQHEFLHMDLQAGVPTVWALVGVVSPMVEKTIHCFGTGWDVGVENLTHIGTIQHNGYVWHYFVEG